VKVLLIYPEFPDTFWSFKYALKFIRKKATYPPLGLLTVAAMLPQQWIKRLFDLNVRKIKGEELKWADLVFISAMNVQRDSVQEIVDRCHRSGVKVVAGGPLFTSEYQKYEEVDHLILNEAELTLPQFLADLTAGRAKHLYQTSDFADIKMTPKPSWDLIELKDYACMSVQFSRGCKFHCDFCNVTSLFGYRQRFKDKDQIIHELDIIYNMGWRGQLFFVDDNFIGNKRYLKTQLLPALIEWRKEKTGMPFNTETSLNIADDEQLMHLMVDAGFDTVFIGIETPDEKCLTECNKKQNLNRDLKESVRRIQRTGLQVQGGFIVGFDSDTSFIFQKQIDFIQETGIVTAMVGMLQAPAGTLLYDRMKREGRLIGEMSGNTDGTTNIIPRMGFETLRQGYQDILRHIYSPKHYYKRLKTFLHECKAPKIEVPLDLQRVFAFFHAFFLLGVFDKERLWYWRILFWVLLLHPRLIKLALTLTIYGYHFRKTSEMKNL
jgi:radical SAM superfamily enzyme YgiQ (UPF0313 family)